MKTIIIRAPSGFGKSTYAEKILPQVLGLKAENIARCSADDFFYDAESNYKFNFNKLGEAHKSCRKKALIAFFYDHKIDVVIIDNTNTTPLEMAFYHDLGSAFGEVEVHTISGDLESLLTRNVHGVPSATVVAMSNRIKSNPLPKYWEAKCVDVQWEEGAFVVDGERYVMVVEVTKKDGVPDVDEVWYHEPTLVMA